MSLKRKIFMGSLVMFLGSSLSSILGIYREMQSAKYFGISKEMDAYLFSYTLPSVILAFIAVFFTSAFIPIYIKKKEEFSELEADRFLSSVINIVICILVFLTILGLIFSNQIAKLFSNEFNTIILIDDLNIILIPSIIFFGLSYMQTAVLYSKNHFLVPSLLPVINNFIVILFMTILHKQMGAKSLALGFLLATILQVFVQVPILKKYGVNYQFTFRVQKSDLLLLCSLFFPIISISFIDELYNLVSKIFSSNLDTGVVSALSYSGKIMAIPITLISTSIISSIYPTLIILINKKENDNLIRLFNKSLKGLLLILIPISIFVCFFAREIVSLLLERGLFNKEATVLTSNILRISSISIILIPIKDLYTKILFGVQNFKKPLLSSILFFIVFLLSLLITFPMINNYSIPVSSVLGFIASISYLSKNIKNIIDDFSFISHLTIFLKIFPLLIVIVIILKILSLIGFANILLIGNYTVIFLGAIYLLIYFIICKALKIEEIEILINILKNKMKIRNKGE